jgi:hypothetical protein
MKTSLVIFALGAALAASCAAQAKPAPPSGPNLKQCGTYKPEEGDPELERKGPLPVPVRSRAVMAANRDFVAVRLLSGATFCLFAREWEEIEPPTLFPNGRFLGFAWHGNEAGGYILIDRAGKGAKFDTGAKPIPSPGGRRLASLEWSESGFGSLNGVLVLDVLPSSLRETARIGEMPEGLTDWRFDRWRSENCIEISALPFAAMTNSDGSAPRGTPRKRFTVQPKGASWALTPASCPAREQPF